jgi:pilus assembly protein CpaB
MVARRLIIALALSLAGSAIFTSWMIKRFSRPATQSGGELHYVATAQNLQAGDVLSPATLKLVSWPSTVPLEGAFPKTDAVVGRIVLFPLAAGEPIIERQLAAPGSTAGLSMKIPDGMRAISLKSDEIVGVAGFLLPGTHVDVLVTYRSPSSPDSVTSTVLQDAQVIAIGQKMEPDPEGKPTTTNVVTLLVNPEAAQKVVEASSLGTVHFVLRNGGDHEQLTNAPIQLSQLGTVGSLPASRTNVVHRNIIKVPVETTPPPAPKPYVVQMVYGEKQTTETPQ